MNGRFLVVVAFLIERDHHVLKEETGLDVAVLGLLDTFHIYRATAREEASGITFHCRATGGDLMLSADHAEAK